MEKKLVPELRFPEFTGEWEEKKLGEVFKERNERGQDGLELLSVTLNNGVIKRTDIDAKDNSGKDKSTYKVVEVNDIAYNSMRMWQGASGVSRFKGIVSPAYTILIPKKDIDSIFFGYMFKTEVLINEFRKNSQGLTSDTWNLKYPLIKQISISMPSHKEQEKIAIFFNLIDKKIEKQEEKIASMEEYKKGMLQKLFPKKGENVPELRFKGFTAPWEQRKLGEIAKFSKGRGYSKNDLTEEGTPIILYGSLYTNYQTVINEVNTFTVDKVNSVYSLGNEVVVPSSGESAEDIARASAIVNKGIILGGDLNIIHSNSNIDPIFLALLISNGERKIELAKKAQGKSVVHLYNTDLEEVNLIYPTREEQTRISDFFSSIDNLITLHQRKLEELKELKKGFMQKMFI